MTSEAPTSSKSPGNSLPSAAKTTNKHGNTFLNSKKIRKAVDHFYEHGFRTRKLKQHFPLSLVNPHNSKITPTLILEDAGLEITGNNHRWARQSVLRELRKRPCKIGEEDEKALMESGLDGSEVAKTVRSAVKRFCVFGFVTSEFRDKYAAKTDGGDPSAEDILKDASLTFPESLSGFLSSWVATCLSVNKRNKENGSTDRKDSPPVKENNLKKGSTPKGKAMKKKAKKAVGPASAVNQQNSTSKKSEKTSKNPPSDKTLEPKKREVSEYKPVQSQKPASALQGQSQGPKVEDALGTGSQNSQKAPMSWGQNFYNGSAVGNENRGYPWFGNKSDYISHFNKYGNFRLLDTRPTLIRFLFLFVAAAATKITRPITTTRFTPPILNSTFLGTTIKGEAATMPISGPKTTVEPFPKPTIELFPTMTIKLFPTMAIERFPTWTIELFHTITIDSNGKLLLQMPLQARQLPNFREAAVSGRHTLGDLVSAETGGPRHPLLPRCPRR